ncbi:hypothetical protein HS088_TW19G00564 [Tripterygium wilfordii]|uniref:FIST C-domain domain-containing protein n=1 Tax=Tripterygium wilfordii TaxID=458696 RepID=A0A7J7C9W6_TRIWF|nr:hypothetical protein HS088_TW19G00564 [Tripterygium wilfordii]
MSGFSLLNTDVLHDILSRLPADAFASAACVNKSWNKACKGILSTPKLASALSLNPNLHEAVNEVVNKVLAEPICPDFAIASIGKGFNLESAHTLITQKLGSRTPIITNVAGGLIGMDAKTSQVKEVKWDDADSDGERSRKNRGILLTVGFVPGLKVDTIPLLIGRTNYQMAMVDQFLIDISQYTDSVSGCSIPSGIILFGDQNFDMKPVMAEMGETHHFNFSWKRISYLQSINGFVYADAVMPDEIAIVGDGSGSFLCRNWNNSPSCSYWIGAVALVFAKDKQNSPGAGIGDVQFNVACSTGVIPFGPQLQAASVEKGSNTSRLTFTMEGHNQILNAEELVDDILDLMDQQHTVPDLFLGVIHLQRGLYVDGSVSWRARTSLTFYQVTGSYGSELGIEGVGINPGDSFLFYHSDPGTALCTSDEAFQNLSALKADSNFPQVLGGFLFSSNLRSKSISGKPNMDSDPFRGNFPGVPLAGVYCRGEIGRGCSGLITQEEVAEENNPRRCHHVYAAVYLVLSYVPVSLTSDHS